MAFSDDEHEASEAGSRRPCLVGQTLEGVAVGLELDAVKDPSQYPSHVETSLPPFDADLLDGRRPSGGEMVTDQRAKAGVIHGQHSRLWSRQFAWRMTVPKSLSGVKRAFRPSP
jgi:hypothetical protein